MNLLELLHNEKVVKTLEQIDNDLKDIVEPGVNDNSIFLKIIMIIETLLKKSKHPNSHIGDYFERYWDTQGRIDESEEELKQKNFRLDEANTEVLVKTAEMEKLEFDVEDKKNEIEKLEWKIKELQGQIEELKWEPQKIKDYLEQAKWDIPKLESEIEKLKWKPIKLKDFIEEASFPIDFKTHEGWMFKKLFKELVENKKLNYNYGKDNKNNK